MGSVAEGNCIRREAGWGATGGERPVCRRTNPIRPGVAASLRFHGEARENAGHVRHDGENDVRAHQVVGDGMVGRLCEISGETCRRGDDGRSQSLHSTERPTKSAKARPRETEARELGEQAPPTAPPGGVEGAGTKPRAEGREAGREIREVDVDASTDARVPERARQASEIRARWAWVEASVWTDRMLAALENGVKGGCWYSLIDKVYSERTLWAAWQRVKRNGGSHGVDGVSVARFAGQEEKYLRELSAAVKNGSYRAEAVRRVHIPKNGGGQRPLGIPAVKDRVVQAALKMVIEPIFEREFAEHSHGFRPGRSGKDALREVDGLLKSGHVWVVDADLQSYFDTIPHDRLLARLGERIGDGRVLSLVQQYLEQDVLSGTARWTPTQGSPQGAVISPLLANVYLHALDVEMAQSGYRMVRYADDFVVMCESEEKAQAALAQVREWVEGAGLALHPDKTHVGNCLREGEGFEFLGYRFEGGRRYVRRKSLKGFKDKIRRTTGRSRGVSMNQIVAELNPLLRGWFAYFQHAHPATFGTLDAFIRRRLRSILCKRHGMSYKYHRSRLIHRRWPNAYFAELGLFTLKAAHASASQSR